MKSSILATTFLLATSILATPHRHFHHQRRHQHVSHVKRNDEAPIFWATEVVSLVKTVQVTTTVWQTPPAPEATPETGSGQQPDEIPSNDLAIPGEFNETQANGLKVPPELNNVPTQDLQDSKAKDEKQNNLPEPNVVPVGPEVKQEEPDHTQENSNNAPPSSGPSDLDPKPIPNVSENSPIEKPKPSQAEISANQPQSPPHIEEPAIQPQLPPQTGSSPSEEPSPAEHAAESKISRPNNTDKSGDEKCSTSTPCAGDITYYDPGVGYGACGWMATKDEPVVALPHEFMGPKSNGNKYCGKTITIEHDGKRSTAKVVDKCMGCSGFSIDLSDAAFTKLSALSVGRTGAKWWINP